MNNTNKLRGFYTRANFTDQATAACQRAFEDRMCRAVKVTDPLGRILGFLDRNRYYFFQKKCKAFILCIF
jgi:hypothetical protein